MNPKTLRPLVAELAGTALFVFFGAGAIAATLAAAVSGGVQSMIVAAAHGVGMAIIVSATMNISGGHINPAVSFALFVAGRINGKTLGQYVGAQLLGALVGAALIKGLLPWGAVHASAAGTPQLSITTDGLHGILIEAMLTFFLVSAVFGTAVSSEAPKIGGFGIGLAIFVCALVGGPFTGAIMNPARAFGPAIIAWQLTAQYVYWVGPLIGATLAGLLWKHLLLPKER
ncbi:MAG: aquaporin [Gemmatimonadetes bacterium]|nr:MAG: aquaporin [Gemmatimonadota bacterium]PYO70496.1 MAG: aquaporin [Gemmatimonadota bacterium]PYO85370.1 MAG: aquaporin [Gemmatimonadota bacterium]PYP64483.1 MAG: aquaporin [Gemmatimonadota bacterium]